MCRMKWKEHMFLGTDLYKALEINNIRHFGKGYRYQ